jgi:hypothetical protein
MSRDHRTREARQRTARADLQGWVPSSSSAWQGKGRQRRGGCGRTGPQVSVTRGGPEGCFHRRLRLRRCQLVGPPGRPRLRMKTVENDRKTVKLFLFSYFFGRDENENQRSKYGIGIVGFSKTINYSLKDIYFVVLSKT